jgi:hypothetical protein
MKGKTHQKITKEVMIQLERWPLPVAIGNALMEGAIEPDKKKKEDPNHKFDKHHFYVSNEIIEYSEKARTSYLRDDLDSAYFNLGIALHFIQDSFTSCFSSDRDEHYFWEKQIEDLPLRATIECDIERTIRETVEHESDKKTCSRLVEGLSNEVQGKGDTLWVATLGGQEKFDGGRASPKVDLYLGFRASYVVTKSILGSKICPEIENKLNGVVIEFEKERDSRITDFINRRMKLVEAKNELMEKRALNKGFFAIFKNWSIDRKIRSIDSDIYKIKNDYERAIDMIVKRYKEKAKDLHDSYGGWYDSNSIFQKMNRKVVADHLQI